MGFLILELVSAAVLVSAPVVESELVAACSASIGETHQLPGLRISEDQPDGNFASLRLESEASGGWMRVYFDAGSERAARSRAACLGAQIALLEEQLADDRRDARWDDVIFTTDATYAPPRGDEVQNRWIIHAAADGSLDEGDEDLITTVIPHEQVHEYQKRAAPVGPRWFREGHASWVGFKVALQLAPDRAARVIAEREAAIADVSESLALGHWGGLQVRPEAILRQLSFEDRARKLADPTFQPNGTFQFGPGDVISDEGNATARYAAAWRIFVDLEAKHGADAVRGWANDLTSIPERLTNEQVVDLARERFGEDLGPLLE